MFPLAFGALWLGSVLYLQKAGPESVDQSSAPVESSSDGPGTLLSDYGHSLVNSPYAPHILFLSIAVAVCFCILFFVAAICTCYIVSRAHNLEESRREIARQNAKWYRKAHSIRTEEERSGTMTRHPHKHKCNLLPSASNMGFALFNVSSFKPAHYYEFKQQERPNSHPYASPGPVQRFRQHFAPGNDRTAQWLNENNRPYHQGASRAGSTVSSCASAVSRLSNVSRLTVLTDISTTNVSPLYNFARDGAENVDPRMVENTLRELSSNPKTLRPEQEEGVLRGVMKLASRYHIDPQLGKVSHLARICDNGVLRTFLFYLLTGADEIVKIQNFEQFPFHLPRIIWKTLCYAVHCNVCAVVMLQLTSKLNVLQIILQGIRRLSPHTPYVVKVFKELLASPFGSQFRQSARIVDSVDFLMAYLPYCDQLKTPQQSATASGNKTEVIDCLRILMNTSSTRSTPAQKKALQDVCNRFVQIGGIPQLIQVLRVHVEEPILNAATKTLKGAIRSQATAEQIIAGGAVQLLASHLGHASPAVVIQCLQCLAHVSDRKEALLRLGEAMNMVISQVVNVLGTTNICMDEHACGFLLNIATISEFKAVLVSHGAVRILLRVVNQHAYSLFASHTEIDRPLRKSYVETLENAIRALAHISPSSDRSPAAETVISELCAFENQHLLQLLTNLLKVTTQRSDLVPAENSFYICRYILLLLERNLHNSRFRALFNSFGEAFRFPEVAFGLLYELNEQWVKSSSAVYAKRMEAILRTIVSLAKFQKLSNGFARCFQDQAFLRFLESLPRTEGMLAEILRSLKDCLDKETVGEEISQFLAASFPASQIREIFASRSGEVSAAAEALLQIVDPNGGDALRSFMDVS